MDAEEMRQIIDFESNLKVDSPVMVHWTNSNRKLVGKGKIIKINNKTFVIELTENVPDPRGRSSGWVKGQKFRVPRITDLTAWTANNRVSPIQ